ncbi:MAG: DNA-binding domain-containing protein [Pseudomonadota bacterium]
MPHKTMEPGLPATSRSLQDMQQQFAAALLDFSQIDGSVALFGGDPVSVRDRLALYRGNLNAIWEQALANAFPVIRALVGEGFFAQLAREYGRLHPSQDGDLNHFGAGFAGFLAQSDSVAAYPYFAEVAELEWLVHRAYYRADTQVLSLAGLGTLTVHGLEQLRLSLHPACCLHQSAWATAAVWLSHQAGSELSYPEQLRVESYAVVSRPEWRVQVMPVSKAAYLALQALAQGRLLGEALEIGLQEDAQFEIAQELSRWFAAGMFGEAIAVAPGQATPA